MEGVGDWQEPEQRKDLPREEVSSPSSAKLRLKRGRRYNDEISLEDAIHTALLTLKEGFEGQMTEKTIEIGIIGIPSATEQSDMARVHGTDENAVALPVFRKLSEAAIKDYLAL
jgi:hypothetical protein